MEKIALSPDLLNYLGSIDGPYKRGRRRAGIREQVMNSYDADASNIKIIFKNFGKNYAVTEDSSIIFEDDGVGIPYEMLQDWFQYKKTNKKTNRPRKNAQGGAGKGRVGTYLLGFRGKISTQPKIDKRGYILNYDFTTSQATLEIAPASTKHGTTIEIFDIRGRWSELRLIGLYDKLIRLARRVSPSDKDKCAVSLWKDEALRFSITYEARTPNQKRLLLLRRLTHLAFLRFIHLL